MFARLFQPFMPSRLYVRTRARICRFMNIMYNENRWYEINYGEFPRLPSVLLSVTQQENISSCPQISSWFLVSFQSRTRLNTSKNINQTETGFYFLKCKIV